MLEAIISGAIQVVTVAGKTDTHLIGVYGRLNKGFYNERKCVGRRIREAEGCCELEVFTAVKRTVIDLPEKAKKRVHRAYRGYISHMHLLERVESSIFVIALGHMHSIRGIYR